jgi:hypothetical protein
MGAIAILAAATSAGFAQHAPPGPGSEGKAAARSAIPGHAPAGRRNTNALGAGPECDRSASSESRCQQYRGSAWSRPRRTQYRRGETRFGQHRRHPFGRLARSGDPAQRQGYPERLADGTFGDRRSHARRGRHACALRSDRPQCFDKTLIGSLSGDQSTKAMRSRHFERPTTVIYTSDRCHR